MGGGMALLTNEAVQKELKVTDEQKDKLKTFAEEQGPKMREKMQEAFQDASGDRAKMAEAMARVNAEGKKALTDSKILDEKQMTRLTQIEHQAVLQQQGPAAFTNAETAKALKLSDEQKDKLKGLADEFRKDRQELMQDARGTGDAATEARKKLQTVTKEYVAKATDVLNSDQKKEWKDMTGEHFELPMMQQGRGGRGGAGGGGGRRGGNNNPPPPV